ncbi:MAG: DUF4446 domain-containing protein [Candidatus Nealsonbacteria bacterium CG_4_8_14_3_um_filter_39_7]|nr:MAG: DUF4446 domain-containing protein [Candidatus Nealsonbacteria bacterium CG_4_8_14_3_um_filter_39_7]
MIGRILPPPQNHKHMFFNKKNQEQPKNFEEIVKHLKENEEKLEKISQDLAKMKKASEFFVQKFSMVRFNPFEDVGGDHSFSMALLNNENSGIVITSLFLRKENRVYGKPIEKGQSKYLLSDEEKKAIEEAINK